MHRTEVTLRVDEVEITYVVEGEPADAALSAIHSYLTEGDEPAQQFYRAHRKAMEQPAREAEAHTSEQAPAIRVFVTGSRGQGRTTVADAIMHLLQGHGFNIRIGTALRSSAMRRPQLTPSDAIDDRPIVVIDDQNA